MSPEIVTRRWKRVEYERLIDAEIFRPGERIELVGGLLVCREPQHAPHATAVRMAEEALRAAFGDGWDVRPQLPIALDDESEPEPDIAVVAGSLRDYRAQHPTHAALIVEVAESSLAFDRKHKTSLYARAQVPECWIVNLGDRVLEVYREPAPDAASAYGWRYTSVVALTQAESVTPIARPAAPIAVSDLLP